MSSAKLTVLIADDEQIALNRLRRLVTAIPDLEIVAECSTGGEVLQCIERMSIDVALLDIEMPELTGLEAKGLMTGRGPQVIFVTAYPEHALQAFDVGAVDYVLKPVEAKRLAQAIDRVRQKLTSHHQVNRLALESSGEIRLVDPLDISHAVFDGHLVTVFLQNESILTDLSLSELLSRLPEHTFIRVHRRAIINLSCVQSLTGQASGGFLAKMATGDLVPISRQAARDLRLKLGLR